MKKITKLLQTQKYFNRIILSVTVSIFLTVSLFSAAVYFITERIFLRNEYETSTKILYQIKYNIDFMNTTVRNLNTSLFINPDFEVIMYNNDYSSDFVEFNVKINRLTALLSTTYNFIHSICVYNGSKNEYVYLGRPFDFEDAELKKIVEQHGDIPKLKPIYRKISNAAGSDAPFDYIFSYFMYDSSGNADNINGAVILNIKPQWFLENVKTINMVDASNMDNIFVLNGDLNYIEDNGKNATLKEALKSAYLEHTSKNSNIASHINGGMSGRNGFFESKLNGERYVVTYVPIAGIDMTLLKIQPASEVYKYANSFKTVAIVLTLVFLLLAIIVSLTISRRIYKPLKDLVSNVTSVDGRVINKSDYKDEISYLNSAYKYSFEKLNKYDDEKNQSRDILKFYWLRQLLVESSEINGEQFVELCNENLLRLHNKGSFIVCILKIDHFKEFQRNHDNRHRKLMQFALINIYTEIIAEMHPAEGVAMDEDHVALVICLNKETTDDYASLESLLNRAKEYMLKYYKISVTAAIGEKVDVLKDIFNSYRNALKYARYRFVLGRSRIITAEKIAVNQKNTIFEYPQKRVDKLAESIKSGNEQGVAEAVDSLFELIYVLSYDTTVTALINLVDVINRAVAVTDKSHKGNHRFDQYEMSSKIFELETIIEFRELLETILKDAMAENPEKAINSQNGIVVETTKDIIHKNYKDHGLCCDSIAVMLRLNPRRLAKMFKETMGLTIADYINEVRLGMAAQLLTNSNFSVYEIVDKVGLDNESYFYRIFKSKFGSTPKEYALIHHLKGQQ